MSESIIICAMNKKMLVGDILLNIVILSLCIVIPLFIRHNESEDKKVVVSVGSKVTHTIPLSDDVVFSPDGEHTYVTVKDGKAYISLSDCPDGLCMKMKKAENANESVICLPNRVSVMIDGTKVGGADVNAG